MEFEALATRTFASRRIVALCSYDVRRCRATDVFEVVQHHPHTLDRQNGRWEMLEEEFDDSREPRQSD
jgi:hypothetical protein